MGKPSGLSSSFELFRRLARRLGVPARDAEDVAQDALVRGLEAGQGIDPAGVPSAYGVKIAVNQARNHVRNAGRRGETLTSFDDIEIRAECPTPEEVLRERQREELTHRLIGEVDPKYRGVLLERDIEEIPLTQIAEQRGLHPEAVKTQHRRAREQLNEQADRWRAKQRSRGWDDAACVAPLGLYRRDGWISSLSRWSLRLLGQVATVVAASAILTAVTSSSSLQLWFRSVVGERWTALSEQAPQPLPPEPGDAQAVSPTAGPGGTQTALLSTGRGDRQPGADVNTATAPSVMAAPRASYTANAARPVRTTISAREVSLIEGARRAIEAGNAEAALEARRLLEAHAEEFPRGRLAAEREALLMQIR
ncbi:RNA polymerase subunit sigma [Sorangium cellulosum]|uniref:RNA polymerase subunit sigma n=1 Tax=Sorangium cellulosum TaxID=56 RepID=A0A150TDY2_SORCE|nr:RNA polymerase subunit sigma [Sorangium cellulosum]